MATIGTLTVNVAANTSKLQKGLRKARTLVGGFASSLKKFGPLAVTSFGIAAAGAFAFAVKTASSFETIRVSLETILGSAQKAKKVMASLQKFSSKTPFQFADIAKGAKQLLAFGVAEEDLEYRLQVLGDISAASGARLAELVPIFGKVKATGILSLEQLNQFAERGIPIYQLMKKQLGITGEQLRKMTSTGKLGFDDLSKALASMTVEGGFAFGAMDKQSKTLAGSWSTLQDNVSLLANSLGKELLPMMTDLVVQLTAATKNTKELVTQVKDFATASRDAYVGANLLLAGTSSDLPAIPGKASNLPIPDSKLYESTFEKIRKKLDETFSFPSLGIRSGFDEKGFLGDLIPDNKETKAQTVELKKQTTGINKMVDALKTQQQPIRMAIP